MAYFDNKKNFLIALKGEPGADGKTPEIINGYWYINGVNTGKKAIGTDGKDGTNGKTPYIQDGYWYIDGVNTGVKAVGEPGTPGSQPYIVLDDGSQGADVTNAITAYQNSANVFWQESWKEGGKECSELCGAVGAMITPPALYFMRTSINRIIKVGVEDGVMSVHYYRTTGDSIQAVMTAEEMHSIITKASKHDVGSFYMYLGKDTTLNEKTYKQGAVYRIGEE